MPIKFAFTRPDGGVSIIHAAPKAHLERLFGPLSDQDYEAHVRERSIPADASNVVKLPDNWVAPDREHRHAWKLTGKTVSVDQSKVKP